MGINHEAPEQMNVLGKVNLVHYLWVDNCNIRNVF